MAFWTCLVGIAIIMTIKYFPGLENEQAYAGNAFQTIFPNSFVGDSSLDPNAPLTSKPLRLSLIYLFPKLVGEIWLNDFFLAFFYGGIVIASLAGIDKIAVTLGLEKPYERLLVLLFFAKDHQLLTGKVLVAHHQDVNHSALAIPVIISLIYLALARKHLLLVLLVSIILVCTSPRIALFPVIFAMAVKFVNGSQKERLAIIAMSALALVVMYIFLFQLYPVPPVDKLQMWDILKQVEGDDANAFHADSLGPMWLRHGVWVVVVAAAFLFPGCNAAARNPVQTIMVCGICLWAVHGIYIEYAPDFLKVPFFISLVPARSLSLVQNIAFIAIISAVVGWLRQDKREIPALLFGYAVLAFLYLIGPGNHMQWMGMLAFFSAVSVATIKLHIWKSGAAKTSFSVYWPALIITPFLLCTAVNYANATHKNWGAWSSAWKYGVYGHNITAKWTEIAPFFRFETKPDTSILPFECAPSVKTCTQLVVNRALATRSGRAISIPDVVGIGFNSASTWVALSEQTERLSNISKALLNGNPHPLASGIDKLVPPPTHLILPRTIAINLAIEVTMPFKQLQVFDNFIIYKRNPGPKT